MFDVLISLSVFSVAAFTHIVLFRFLEKRGIHTFKSVLVFAIGFGIEVCLLGSSFPVTSIIIYLCMTASYILLFTAPFLGDISPSMKTILVLKKGKKMEKEIINEFSDKELIVKRISGLESSGKIKKIKGRYYIQKSGAKIILFLEGYRRLLNWDK